MRIAIIGSGISGLGAAWSLEGRHSVRLYEARARLGGHTHTIRVERPEGTLDLDTGFLIFNRRTYPLLTRLFDRLDVPTQNTDMSFSVSCGACDLEYAGRGLRGLFAQRRNAVNLRFLRMLGDIARFARHADAELDRPGEAKDCRPLGEFLRDERFGRDFQAHYIEPMAAALWSSGPGTVRRFPIGVLLAFFRNHGLLRVRERLDWQTVPGGSSTYVRALARRLAGRVRLDSPVARVERHTRGVDVVTSSDRDTFDHVVIATHADQALRMLGDPTEAERALLSAWDYASNDVWLHTDVTHLPRRPATWSAWNYQVADCRDPGEKPTATYGLNQLQRIESDTQYLVTLNPTRRPATKDVMARMTYRHPGMTPESTATWADLPSLNESGRVSFCGSYFGAGFHEDGLRSGIAAAEALGGTTP